MTEIKFESKKNSNRIENYQNMLETAKSFIDGETDLIALLSNLSALIKVYIDDLNWAGFYLLKDDELVLGPFQGNPACARIAEGKGVCGRAVIDAKPIIVDDVNDFKGHIACDSASLSELVIPIFKNGKVFGVLDLDSPLKARFSDLELDYLSKITKHLSVFLDGNMTGNNN